MQSESAEERDAIRSRLRHFLLESDEYESDAVLAMIDKSDTLKAEKALLLGKVL
jgi:hypothetical protein